LTGGTSCSLSFSPEEITEIIAILTAVSINQTHLMTEFEHTAEKLLKNINIQTTDLKVIQNAKL